MPAWLLSLALIPLAIALAAAVEAIRVLRRRRRVGTVGGRVDSDGYLRLKRRSP